MFKVAEYNTITPPLIPVLLRNDILAKRMVVLENTMIANAWQFINNTLPVIVILLNSESIMLQPYLLQN